MAEWMVIWRYCGSIRSDILIIEPRWILTMAMALMLVGFMGIWKAPSITFLMITGPLFGVAYGTALIMFSAILANYFGADSFASINGFIVPFMLPFAASVPVAAGYIADRFGNYDLAFMILSVILFMGIICAAVLAHPTKTKSTSEDTKVSAVS